MIHRDMKHSSSTICYDIMVQILCRLPVKSLVRLCCVCKYWKNLITTDHALIKSHLQQSLHSNPSSHRNSSICRALVLMERDFRHDYLSKCYPDRYMHPGESSFLLSIDDYLYVGCSNGVLCYYDNPRDHIGIRIHLLNPALHQFRTLPSSISSTNHDHDLQKLGRTTWGENDPLLGFVFDPLSNDYKVVKIYHEIEVYSLSKNTWKVINSYPFPFEHCGGMFYSKAVFHNGALHWIVTAPFDDILGSDFMLFNVFDIHLEKFHESLVPDFVFQECMEVFYPTLGVFEECLSLMLPKAYMTEFEFWVIKKCGIDYSWAKQFVMRDMPDLWYYCFTRKGKIVASKKDGEDVAFFYDLESQKVEEILQNKVIFIRQKFGFVDEYVESLVPVIPLVEQGEAGRW